MFSIHNFRRMLGRAAGGLSTFAFAASLAPGQVPGSNTAQNAANAQAVGDEINQGVQAYKSARYDEAVDDFRKAVELDPNNATAKLYLGTALAQNVVPGLNTPENLKTAEQAIRIFQQVLAKDPHDVNSMKQIAGIDFAINKLDDAKEWQQGVLDENPADADAAYTISVIDWTEAHKNALKALQAAGLNDDGQGNAKAPATALRRIKEQNEALVAEALQYLQQAIEDRPDYSDAMVYLNLVYRRKADLDWDNAAARADDLAKAEEWTHKALAARKTNEERKMAKPAAEQPDSSPP